MKLLAQEIFALAAELLANPTMSLQEGLNSIGFNDIDAVDLSRETLEDLHEMAIQCACGFWRRPNEVNGEGVCHKGCPE